MHHLFLLALSSCVFTTPPNDYLPAEQWDIDQDGFPSGIDCNDEDPNIHPEADEICDGLDNDCDTLADDNDEDLNDGQLFYRDADGDGYGSPLAVQRACVQPMGFVTLSGDCADDTTAIHPNQTETCNEIDDNCDGVIDLDSELASTWYLDNDDDGHGDPTTQMWHCGPLEQSGWVQLGDDCDDTNPHINPAAAEICDGIDNDCNEQSSEAEKASWITTERAEDWTEEVFNNTELLLADDGELHLCSGVYPTSLQVTGDVAIIGHGDEVTLTSHLQIGNSTSSLQNLSIIGAQADSSGQGGGIACTNATLSLENVRISQNTAAFGGGIAATDCSIMINNSRLAKNTSTNAGGALYLQNSSLEFSNSTLFNNLSDSGAAAWLDDESTLQCNALSTISANEANDGAVKLFENSTFNAHHCNLGIDEEENWLHDIVIEHEEGLLRYRYEDDQSFNCASGTCENRRMYTTGMVDSSLLVVNGGYHGVMYDAFGIATLHDFQIWADFSSGCPRADLYVHTRQQDSEQWILQWRKQWTPNSQAQYWPSGIVGLYLTQNQQVAIGIASECTFVLRQTPLEEATDMGIGNWSGSIGIDPQYLVTQNYNNLQTQATDMVIEQKIWVSGPQ